MATMHDVARRAHVSPSTVSYALSGVRPVSAPTRRRIELAMTELGYQPNAMARGLASRRSNVLALIYPTMGPTLGGTVSELVAGAAQTAREHGYHLVLWPLHSAQAPEMRDLVQQRLAAGVLLMEVVLDDERVVTLQDAGVPFTMIGRTRELAGRPWVDIDFERTADDAVALLVRLGHRHIAFVNHSERSHDEGYGPTHRAAAGFDAAMRARGLEPHALLCDDSPQAGRQAIDRLFAAEPRLTAIVTMNEIAMFGVLAELQQRGLDVPRAVSVLPIVTSPGVPDMSDPRLTTTHAPGGELGSLGVRKLLSLVDPDRPSVPDTLVLCTLEPGRSVAPAPNEPAPPTRR